MREKDLTGKKIGMLYVEEMTVSSPWNKKSYRCRCDCGNTCVRLHLTLSNSKHIHNCGCYNKAKLTPGDKVRCTKAGKNRKNAFVNGSNVSMTFRNGVICSNTSGTQGVSWSSSAHKWHVYVGYQNYRANIGYFEDMETAVCMRKKAEEAIKNGVFEDFFLAVRGYRLGERNSKQYKSS